MGKPCKTVQMLVQGLFLQGGHTHPPSKNSISWRKTVRSTPPPAPCYMCYMYYMDANPLNLHSPPGPCYMCYMCYVGLTRPAAEPPLSPSSMLYVLYVLYLFCTRVLYGPI